MTPRSRSLILGLLSALALAWIASQWTAIRAENVNWDEFALLARARATLTVGTLFGAGRPGLALLPRQAACVKGRPRSGG